MASSTILSPRPLELAPAASLSELDQFCSGPLDAFLEEAARFKRSPMQPRSGHFPSKAAAGHKRSGSGSGKSSKAAAVKKALVSCMRICLTHWCCPPACHSVIWQRALGSALVQSSRADCTPVLLVFVLHVLHVLIVGSSRMALLLEGVLWRLASSARCSLTL